MSSMLPPMYSGSNVTRTPGQGNKFTSPYLVDQADTPVRDAGSGRGDISPAQKSRIFDMTPRARQLYLRSMGFNVKVDGNSGPQTAAAAWSFVHGHNASWYNQQGRDWQQSIWNQHFAKYHKVSSPHDPSTVAPAASAGAPVDKNNHGGPGNPSDSQFSGSMDAGLASVIGGGLSTLDRLSRGGTLLNPALGDKVGTLLDPTTAGAAAAESAYGQSIRDNARVIARAPGEAAQHLADLKSWYGKVGEKQAAGAADVQDMADKLISSSEGAKAGLTSALGGDANMSATDLGAAGENEAATLRALKLVAASGADEMSGAIGAEGLSARTRQRILDENALTDARNKATDLTAQAGAVSTKAQQDAIAANNAVEQQRFSNHAGIVGANNALIGDRAQRTAALLSASEAAAMLPANMAYKSATGAAALAKARAASLPNGGKLPKGAFDNTDAKTKGSVADSAVQAASAIIANKGSVEDAVKTVNNLYRSRGWSLKNPRVVKAVMASLRGAGIQVDPQWWAKFGYKGG